jgi:predicted HicB family RNase H-like nuclease
MDERTQQSVEKELKEATIQRKAVEENLNSFQEQIKKLQENIEFSFDALKALQQKENNLKEELYQLQKESIKDAVSLGGLKKIFGDSTPFFSSLKGKAVETVQKVKGYMDGSYFDQKWLDEKYDEYKEHCIQKGEEIKTKEEFQKIALALRKMQNQNEGEVNFFDVVGKVSKEVGTATTSVKSVFQSLGFVEKITNALNVTKEDVGVIEKQLADKEVPIITKIDSEQTEPKDKKVVFSEWIENRNVKKSKTTYDVNSLYEDYKLYVAYVYPEEKDELTQETVPVDGKPVKKVGLKVKKP